MNILSIIQSVYVHVNQSRAYTPQKMGEGMIIALWSRGNKSIKLVYFVSVAATLSLWMCIDCYQVIVLMYQIVFQIHIHSRTKCWYLCKYNFQYPVVLGQQGINPYLHPFANMADPCYYQTMADQILQNQMIHVLW